MSWSESSVSSPSTALKAFVNLSLEYILSKDDAFWLPCTCSTCFAASYIAPWISASMNIKTKPKMVFCVPWDYPRERVSECESFQSHYPSQPQVPWAVSNSNSRRSKGSALRDRGPAIDWLIGWNYSICILLKEPYSASVSPRPVLYVIVSESTQH